MGDVKLYRKIKDIADRLERITFLPNMPNDAARQINGEKTRLRELAESLLPQENEN